ncbi:5'/3'-nucleotidase SurE [Halovenus marina]|uniref:5'/3'-nucleotidase SurE n=1 Tax=Halovenus marina TaxID=3396621 RepID=UPI003F5595A2
MDEPSILLTNDDGIDAAGLHAVYDALSTVGTVTVVAPAEDQSAVGRTVSNTVSVRDHELGYVIEGTPADSVIAGVSSLCPDIDLVVAGCNRGANLGAATLGRSGTVSAAVEAALLDVPAIAVSMYIPVDEYATGDALSVPDDQYAEAVRATKYLVEHTLDVGVFEVADYLNLNAPVADRATGKLTVTRPSEVYRMDASRSGTTVELNDAIWELMANGDIPDAEGTDRRAILDGHVSVSPLTAPHTTEHHRALDALADTYPDE